MTNIPRRKLNEVATRYKLEPQLDDIYVEGSTDKRLIDRAFKELSVHRPVYEIDSIDIPDEVLEKHGLTRGNKQEVIALCLELNLDPSSNVSFFVDRDMDHHLDRMYDLPRLIYTEHCDLEGVFLEEDYIREMICDAAGVKCDNWQALYESIELAVKKIYSLRIVLEKNAVTEALPSPVRSLDKNGKEVVLDIDHLLNRCNAVRHKRAEVIAEIDKFLIDVRELEARLAGRGHDYFDVLEWTIKKLNGSKNIAEALPNLLMLLAPRKARAIVAPFVA